MKNNWIKCSERLPKNSKEYVLIFGLLDDTSDEKKFSIGYYDLEKNKWFDNLGKCYKISHWQEISKPE